MHVHRLMQQACGSVTLGSLLIFFHWGSYNNNSPRTFLNSVFKSTVPQRKREGGFNCVYKCMYMHAYTNISDIPYPTVNTKDCNNNKWSWIPEET
jgi:hypothetical protein